MQTGRLVRPFSTVLVSSCRQTHVVRRTHPATRSHATVATSGPAVTATNRAAATLKRFWKTVSIEQRDNSLAVTLDKRPLRTPSGNLLLVPQEKKLVATLIAAEWEYQETLLKPHTLPVTSLASRAIDAFTDEKTHEEVREQLLKYLDTDTICFYQNEPPALAALQEAHWSPILDWARSTFGVEIRTSNSFLPASQPPATRQRFDDTLSKFNHWEMAAMERATYTSKSFLIALALVSRRISVEEAALAAHAEVNSQIQRWGEVEDSHDVDYHDVRRHLGSAACLLSRL